MPRDLREATRSGPSEANSFQNSKRAPENNFKSVPLEDIKRAEVAMESVAIEATHRSESCAAPKGDRLNYVASREIMR